jgi:deoxyribodipyrimidine photolyase-like uncharacterized protein
MDMPRPIETPAVVLGDQMLPRFPALADFIAPRLEGAVTRAAAVRVFRHEGDLLWQDAMRRDQSVLFHAADGDRQFRSAGRAASGVYIARISDFCRTCVHCVKQATGAKSCSLNFLAWDFVTRHAGGLAANLRMAMPLRTWERMDPARRTPIRARAGTFPAALEAG